MIIYARVNFTIYESPRGSSSMSCICTQGGLFFDRRLRNDTGFAFGTKYTPLSNPQDEASTPQTAVFKRLTGKLWTTIAAFHAFPADLGKMLDFFYHLSGRPEKLRLIARMRVVI